jgi:hypothetical protein
LRHAELTDEIRETACLYALHSLSQHEARAFELHLQDRCSVCEAELREFERVAADLGIGAGAMQPPDYLADLLMARIEHETVVARPDPRPEPPAKATAAPEPSLVRAVPAAAPRAGRTFAAWTLAAALAVAAIAALYGWREARRSVDDLGKKLAAAQEDNGRLRAEGESEKARLRGLAPIADFMASPGTRIIRLAGQAPAPTASGVIIWDTAQHRWLIDAILPPAAQGKVYELWFVTATAKIRAGLLRTDGSGRIVATIDVSQDAGQLTAAGVTLEPEGGSAQPTTHFYLLGTTG